MGTAEVCGELSRAVQIAACVLCAGFGSEGTTWIYANPEALVNAAVTGVFMPTTRWDYWDQPKEKRLVSEPEHELCSMVG